MEALMQVTTTFDHLGFAARLRDAREHALLSQEGLAKAIDVHKSTINAWERGTKGGQPLSKPTPQNLSRLGDALKVSVEWLLTGKGDQNSPVLRFQQAKELLLDAAEAFGGGRPTGVSLTWS
jgi:transcriptional regulator with XRE-family HTH domain